MSEIDPNTPAKPEGYKQLIGDVIAALEGELLWFGGLGVVGAFCLFFGMFWALLPFIVMIVWAVKALSRRATASPSARADD